MNVTGDHLENGALWTFVQASTGKETEYVFDRQLAPAGGGLAAVYALKNPVTNKDAMVSERWLRSGQSGVGSYWKPKATAREMHRAA